VFIVVDGVAPGIPGAAWLAAGRCTYFAATGDGTGWAEGAGVVRNGCGMRGWGHLVLAVVRGRAVPGAPVESAVI